MKKKRSIVLLTVIALVCLMLAGCKSADEKPEGTGDAAATEAPAQEQPTEAPAATEAPAEPAATEAPADTDADVDRSTIYVNAEAGDDNASGATKEEAFQTIAKAVEVAEPGSEILVAPGTYIGKIWFETSGTADERITLRAEDPANRPVLTAGSDWSEDDFDDGYITIEDASFITIEGFEIKDYRTTSEDPCPIGIHVCGDSDGVIINNCYIHDCGIINDGTSYNAHGILVSGDSKGAVNDITIENCELCNLSLGNSESLVLNGNVDGFIVRNNLIHDNDNIGIDFIGYEETYSDPTFDRARNGECTGNTVYNITSEFNPTYEGDICADGIYVDGGDNIVIKDNVVYNCDIGIETASEHQGRSTSNIVIDNNLIFNCLGYTAICFGGSGETNGTAVGIRITNNTIYGSTIGIAIQQADDPTNIVQKNIIQNSSYADIEGSIGANIITDNLISSEVEGNIEVTLSFSDPEEGNFMLADEAQASEYASYGYHE